MLLRDAKVLGVVGLMLACLTPQVASQTRTGRRPTIVTFTSTDGLFQFQYPSSYVLCGENTDDSDYDPDRSCHAYSPVCLASSSWYETYACVAYPAGEYRGTNFSAAAFSFVELKRVDTARKCLSREPNLYYYFVGTETINGIRFKVLRRTGVGLGNIGEEYLYRHFRSNKCYELGIRISYTNFGNYEPGAIDEFTTADHKKVYRSLKKILSSFRFLAPDPKTPGHAARPQTTRHKAIRTFISPAADFQFKYQGAFVLCGEDEDPNLSCTSYIPVCHDDPLACVAYPQGEYTNTNFEGAGFSVARIDEADSEAKCLSPPHDGFVVRPGETVNGARFKAFYFVGAATSHRGEQHTYRAFRKTRCYELSIRLSTTNFAVIASDDLREFTAKDQRKVHRDLNRILRSFRFLQ